MLFATPVHPYNRDLLADANRRARTAAIKGEPPNQINLLPVLRPGYVSLRE